MFQRVVAICTLIVGLITFSFSADAAKTTARLLTSDSGPMVRLPGHVLPALARATVIRPAEGARISEADQLLTLTIILKRDDQAAFDRYLHDVYDSRSPIFRHFLTQSAISDRFGPTPEAYGKVLAYLRTNGFAPFEQSKNRLTVTVRGTRTQAERTFNVRIHDYQIGRRSFYANDQDPGLPPELASHVQSVAGLANLAKPRNGIIKAIGKFLCSFNSFCTAVPGYIDQDAVKRCETNVNNASASDWGALIHEIDQILKTNCPTPVPTSAPSMETGLNPTRTPVRSSTPLTATPWLSVDGTGQKIGLVEFDTFQTSDVTNFLALVGLPASRISHLSQVPVNGGATPGSNQDEVLLDIDAALTVAPGASTVVYDAPFSAPGASFQAVLNQMINDGVTIISNSWAYCEDQTNLSDVQSIDNILATAAASGISVFNGAGDTGSTCLDSSPNTAAVPADSPHATAVGGTSLTTDPSGTYQSETWWNGVAATPPTGQGGFGLSKFFSRPAYQNGLNPSLSRSVPDVVVNADPAKGVIICEANAGGCPTGFLYGGTSNAAPVWASFAALLNQAHGSNLGAFNPLLYPLAGTDAFHSSASIGSDFAHVGLGSPNIDNLHLLLNGEAAGPASATQSQVTVFTQHVVPFPDGTPAGVPADGKSTGSVVVRLWDANGNSLAGKTIKLSATSGGHAKISPSSAISDTSGGVVTFAVSDLSVETVVFTATDTTDGVVLQQTATVPFVTPPAAAAGLNAFPTTVTADGKSVTTITLTLKDSLSRPTSGKLVALLQGNGQSVIKGPVPSMTDTNGQIQFIAVDQVPETVTYSAVDISDGNVPFPTTGTVVFTGGPANGCGNAAPLAAPGFLVTPYATGFITQSYSFGDIDFTCGGAYGLAFDKAGKLYVSYGPTGDIYKFPVGGGVADASTLLTTTAIGPTLSGLVFDNAGNFFASRDATTGNFLTGAVLQIDPANGTVTRTVAPNLTCPTALAVDPLSGDLFTDDSCFMAGSNNPDMWRIVGPDTPTPKTTVYTTLPGTPNVNISFASSGTIYAWAIEGTAARVAQISGTNKPTPPTVNILPNLQVAALGLLASGVQSNGDAQSLFLNPFDASVNQSLGIGTADLTTNPPSRGIALTTGNGANNLVRGPDGCVYAAQGDGVFKITDSQGTCNYATPSQPASLVLAPPTISPNPAQGTSQNFTARFHYTKAPLGTPILFQVSGANPQVKMVLSDTNGQASFSYAGVFPGVDTITASSTLGTTRLTSNNAVITWASGQDTSFLTLNLSPTSVMAGKAVTLVASLSDVSVTPPKPITGADVQFNLEGHSCSGATDAKGNASCTLTPTVAQLTSQTASFTGNSTLLPATATQQFNVTGPPTFIPTFTPGKTPARTPTPKPTPSRIIPTQTPTALHTLTPTPHRTPAPTPTPRECIATTPKPTVPVPTPTPMPGNPVITSLTNPVLVGGKFTINGRNFSKKPMVNFFVATANGPTNEGPLTPSTISSTQLLVPVPATKSPGEGFVSVVVINTDEPKFPQSNQGFALLQGSAAAGLPSISGLNGHVLAESSLDPGVHIANVETTLLQGSSVLINGNGFDVTHGVAVDVFCGLDCPPLGKLTPPIFLSPGNSKLTANSITFTLPATAPTGPGSIQVSNAGPGGTYTAKSQGVSVPLGARIIVTKVTQNSSKLTVEGAGFSKTTVINFFNAQPAGEVNLGGLNPDGSAQIKLTPVSSTKFTFTKPAKAIAGLAYVQALNPPFIAFTSSGNDPCGAFTLK